MIFNRPENDKKKKQSAFEGFIATENGRLTEDSAKRYFSFLGFSILLVFLIQAILQLILWTILPLIFPSATENIYVSYIVSSAPKYFIAMPIGAILLKKLPLVTPLKSRFSAKKWIGGMCIAFALMLAGNTISQYLAVFFSALRGSEITNPVATTAKETPLLITFIFIVIIAPIFEELFFRKVLCDRLLAIGDGYAIFVSSAIFALAHENFFQLFYAFFIGCFFSYIYVNTGKIKISIVYHIIINFVGTIVVTLITSRIDINAIAQSGITVDILKENTLPIIAFLAYDFIMMGASFAGVFLIFKNYKKIKMRDGILPPPENAKISCVFMNFGIACSIAYFAFKLVFSLLI